MLTIRGGADAAPIGYDGGVRMRGALAVVIGLAFTACSGEAESQDGAVPKSCAQAEADLAKIFRPLPPRFEYLRIPEKQVDALLAEGFRAIAGRAVLEGDRNAGAVIGQVSTTPIRDEAEHLRGAAHGLKADSTKTVKVNGRDVKRMTSSAGTWYVSIHRSCTVLSVQGEDPADAEEIARAVFP